MDEVCFPPMRGTGSQHDAAPVAYVYEGRQPLTDPAIWCEFFSRDEPKRDDKWIRNVRALVYAPQGGVL